MCTTNEDKVLQIHQPLPSASPSNLAPQGTESYSYLNSLSPGDPSPEAQALYKQYTSKPRFSPRELREKLCELEMPSGQKNIDNGNTPQPKDTPGSPDDGLGFCLPAIAHEMKSTDSEAIHNKRLAIIENTLVRASNELDLINVQREYAEPVDKKPVFETFVQTTKLNKSFAWSSDDQHSFIGLRFTYYDPSKEEYVRMHFKIGFYPKDKTRRMEMFTNREVTHEVIDDMNHAYVISTKTEITPDKIPTLVDSIISYFAKYKYRYFTRNCNTFTKAMARQLGISNIVSLHDSIAPPSVANSILNALTASDSNDVGKMYELRFDSDKKPLDFEDGRLKLPISADSFEKEAREAGSKDLNFFEKIYKKVDFKAKETASAIGDIKRTITEIDKLISNFNNDTQAMNIDEFIEEMSAKCASAEEELYGLVAQTKSSHTHLKIYLMRIANLFFTINHHLKGDSIYSLTNMESLVSFQAKNANTTALYNKSVDQFFEDMKSESERGTNATKTFWLDNSFSWEVLQQERDLIFYTIFQNEKEFTDISRDESFKDLTNSKFSQLNDEEIQQITPQISNYIDTVFSEIKKKISDEQTVKAHLINLITIAHKKTGAAPIQLCEQFVKQLCKKIAYILWHKLYNQDNYLVTLFGEYKFQNNRTQYSYSAHMNFELAIEVAQSNLSIQMCKQYINAASNKMGGPL